MRMRCWAAAVATLAVAAVLPGRTAAQPDPTIEVRVRSVNDLLDKAEYVGGLVDKDEPVRQVRELVKQLSAGGKGLEGVDPKRPFGAYTVLAADVANSPAVVMVPIADEQRFLGMLKERLMVVPEKADDGSLKANVPLLDEVHLRFANGYLYIARDPKHIEAKGLVDPKAFFAKDDRSVASVVVRIDRIPADLKTFALGQFEHQAREGLRKDGANKPPAQKQVEALVVDTLVGSTKAVVEDGKEFSVKLFIDEKADELSAEVTLVPKDGTALAKTVAGLAGKTSLPAGIVAAKDAVARGGAKVELNPDFKKKIAPLVDNMIEEVVKQANPNEREAARRVLTTLAPTLKAGELDAAASLVGPDDKGKYALLAAVAVRDGKEIEKLLKDFAPMAPRDEVEFTFDTAKVGNFALHKVEFKRVDRDFQRVFGTQTVWLATSENCVALSVEPDGARLKAGLAAKPVAAPVFVGEVSVAKALPLFNPNLKPDEVNALMKDAFGGAPAGKDTVTVTVEGGKQLTARVKGKGKVLRLVTGMNELKGK